MDLPAGAWVTKNFRIFGQSWGEPASDRTMSGTAYGSSPPRYNHMTNGQAAVKPSALASQTPRFIVFSTLLTALWIISMGLISLAGAEETAAPEPIKVVALGTSLTAGYGLEQTQGFVPQLQKALEDQGLNAIVENAGVSGDTSAGGLARLDWSLNEDVDAVIVELGSNDALRGFEPQQTRENLTAILEALTARGLPVLLTGMLAPPNLGEEYGEEFASIYPDLAAQYGVLFYPFFLEGVAAEASLNQADGIHPNAEGVQVIVEAITPYAVQLVEHARNDTPS